MQKKTQIIKMVIHIPLIVHIFDYLWKYFFANISLSFLYFVRNGLHKKVKKSEKVKNSEKK